MSVQYSGKKNWAMEKCKMCHLVISVEQVKSGANSLTPDGDTQITIMNPTD